MPRRIRITWTLATLVVWGGQFAAAQAPPIAVEPPVRMKAIPFELRDVRLLDGPIRTKQDLNHRYLKQLDPDRLLHNFRVTVGLPSSAKPLGGWENPKNFCRGHFTGHYLSACALAYASVGDEKLREKAHYMVSELAKCQRAFGGKYLGPFPAHVFDGFEKDPPEYREYICVPYYMIHKLLAGLLDAYRWCGDRLALEIAGKIADYFMKRLDRCTREQIERMFLTTDPNPLNEFGGMSEALHNLYAATGNQEHLVLAHLFDRGWFLDPLSRGEDNLTNLHSNTHVPQILGAMRHYELTGYEPYRRAALFFWRQVALARSYANGGNSGPRPLGSPRSAGGEHWAAPYELAGTLTPEISESCVCHNILKVTSGLFSWTAEPGYMDFYERAYFNSVLGMQHPGYPGGYIYYYPLSSGSRKKYGEPERSFWCCYGTGVETFSRLADNVYFHDDKSLWVNLFVASEVNWRMKGLRVEQRTRFPEEAATVLIFHTAKPVRVGVNLRVPRWATAGFKMTINGKARKTAVQPGSFLSIDRTWLEGDRVEVRMSMRVQTLPMPDDPNVFAILYGPIVLAALTPESLDVDGNAKEIPSSVHPVPGNPMTFSIRLRKGGDVLLVPLYRVVAEQYGVYFTVKKKRAAS